MLAIGVGTTNACVKWSKTEPEPHDCQTFTVVSGVQPVQLVITPHGPFTINFGSGCTANPITVTTNVPANFTTRDSFIARVANGIITGIGGINASTYIVATATGASNGTGSDSVLVTITNNSCQSQQTQLVLSPRSFTFNIGAGCSVVPGTINANVPASYVSRSSGAVTVSSLGTVTPGSTTGTFYVVGTATGASNGVGTDSVQVIVTNTSCQGPPPQCTFNPSVGIVTNGTLTLTGMNPGQIFNIELNCPNGITPKWRSNHEEIVQIQSTDGTYKDSSGHEYKVGIHATILINAKGSATITLQNSITDPTPVGQLVVNIQ
jgi:hypothetical protein